MKCLRRQIKCFWAECNFQGGWMQSVFFSNFYQRQQLSPLSRSSRTLGQSMLRPSGVKFTAFHTQTRRDGRGRDDEEGWRNVRWVRWNYAMLWGRLQCQLLAGRSSTKPVGHFSKPNDEFEGARVSDSVRVRRRMARKIDRLGKSDDSRSSCDAHARRFARLRLEKQGGFHEWRPHRRG